MHSINVVLVGGLGCEHLSTILASLLVLVHLHVVPAKVLEARENDAALLTPSLVNRFDAVEQKIHIKMLSSTCKLISTQEYMLQKPMYKELLTVYPRQGRAQCSCDCSGGAHP
jgi:hypothetical protein